MTPEAMAEQLRRFNEEQAALAGGKPRPPGVRLPIPWSGVGGDVPPPHEIDWTTNHID